ncbi:MAG TPA: hypothetical protein PKW24_00010 [Clostridiales bacterium]|nr:hypothetical protein [Clostridiales bacterium]
MKKSSIIVLALLLTCNIFLFSACELGKSSYVLDISGAKIGKEIYGYYLDEVLRSPKKYPVGVPQDEALVRQEVIKLCKNYVAANSLLAQYGVHPDYYEKQKVTSRVNGLWSFMGPHYESLGISKQTLTKIETANVAKESLVLSLYDPDKVPGLNDEIFEYYKKNFILFLSVNGYFTKLDEDGDTVEMTDEEKALVRSRFENMRQSIDEGDSIGKVAERYFSEIGLAGATLELNMIQKGGHLYPEGFFDKLSALEAGKAKVLEFGPYIFLVVKQEISDQDENYFSNRTAMLTALKADEVGKIFEDAVKKYEVEVNEKLAQKLFKKTFAEIEKLTPAEVSTTK